MFNKSDILIILDSPKYRDKESLLKVELKQICNPYFYYTYYENNLVKFLHSLPTIGNFLSHIAYWSISLKEAIKLAIYKKKNLNKIFINPIVAIFYSGLTRALGRKEIITIAGFLFEDKSNKLYLMLRKLFVNFCYKEVNQIIVYSKNEVSLYSEWFPDLRDKFIFITYGRDFDIFEENEYVSNEPYVASGGVSNRDFSTLFKAFSILENRVPGLKCRIATRPQAINNFSRPKNITTLYNIRIDTFGSFLEKSIFVVIPLANTFISAGHMALLESMYRSKIILTTDIPAVRDYLNENVAYFYNPEDEQSLANMIEYIYLNIDDDEVKIRAEAAHKLYLTQFNFAALLKRIVVQSCKDVFNQ